MELRSLPEGRRRELLHDGLEQEVLPLFTGLVLAFDLTASQAYAELMANAPLAGRTNSASDGYIAVTAAANSMMVATQDRLPFDVAGLRKINLWTA